jgi:hypothetical protein
LNWRLLLLLAALAGGILLAACERPTTDFKGATRAGKTDWCGYTWQQTMVPADVIEFVHEPNWDKYPGQCRIAGIQACASRRSVGSKSVVTILTTRPHVQMLADPGDCNAVHHELQHALGLTHAEEHMYVPQDKTRR